MAQEYGAMRQQVRDLESRLCDKDKELLTIYRRSSERTQEVLRHRGLWQEERKPLLLRSMSFRSSRLQRSRR
jgi:hypothetical protein